MFGFVKPFIPSLRVGEYEFYKSVYCGLCRSMKKHTGLASSMTLSFDMAFFALARLALSGEPYTVKKGRCMAHPVHRRPILCDNLSLAYSAGVSAALVLHKLRDTVADERGLKKLAAVSLTPYARAMVRRGGAELADANTKIASAMAALAALETEKCRIPDLPAEQFGNLLGELLAFGFENKKALIARELGLHVGRFVYLADAIVDYADDRKSGSYNPFLYAFSEESEMADFKKNTLHGVMSAIAEDAARALSLIDFPDAVLRAVMENIICQGMENALTQALEGKEASHDKGSL